MSFNTLTADCQIVDQTNRIVYLNIDFAIEIEMSIKQLEIHVISNLMEENKSFV
jgi:hypothetical protein